MGNKVSIKVPKSSGKNLSHRNNLTGDVGTLVPLLVREPVVGERCRMSLAIDLNLPPLASKTYANIDYKVEAFFVPYRILVGGFEDWFSGANLKNYSANFRPCMPVLSFPVDTPEHRALFAKGTLSDYLGAKSDGIVVSSSPNLTVSALPYLAYHRIYDDWYRNPQVQQPVFSRLESNGSISRVCSGAPWLTFVASSSAVAGVTAPRIISMIDNPLFRDDVNVYDLRQRNFGFDYFTQAVPNPQLGSAPTISVGSTMSISQIRAANSMQLWQERNVIAGPRFVDAVKSRYGVELSDGVAQRPIYLGSASFNVYSNGIYQTQTSPSSGGVQTTNPFSSIGSQYGSVSCQGSQLLIDDFTAREPGLIMVIGSLVPRATYSSGIAKYLYRYVTGPDDVAEMASPLLQNIGNEPIYGWELSNGLDPLVSVFGYVPRYSSWNTMFDEVHGKFCDGEDLQSFLCQRSFDAGVSLSSSFLQIPKDFLDQIFAVEADKGFGYWLDCFFDYRVSNCLSDFAIPSLQDPAYEHGRSVTVNFGGTSL